MTTGEFLPSPSLRSTQILQRPEQQAPETPLNSPGTAGAGLQGMAVPRYQDLIAWQMGEAFKVQIYQIVQRSNGAQRDYRFRSQILEAARSVPVNIAEGFLRYAPREFARFIDYALGSLAESESRLRDGIQLGYFSEAECAEAFRLGRRCLTASVRLKQSQKLFLH